VWGGTPVQGTKYSHNNCEGVWIFEVNDFTMTTDKDVVIRADKVKIIAIDAATAVAGTD
jgi:hypothetical protein